jgi:hypothetical protein
MVEKTEQIVREAPEVEAYKLGLLESAKKLADTGVTLPAQQVAGMSGLQTEAIRRATAGIGDYEPYLTEAGYTLGDAQGVLGTVAADADPFKARAAEVTEESLAGLPGYQQRAAGVMEGALNQLDPSAAAAYFNPFEQAAVQQTLQDIERAGELQKRDARLSSVGQPGGPSAFGGSRAALEQIELDRNILEQQARTAAQMRQAGFESAAQRAQQAGQLGSQIGSGIGGLGTQFGQLNLAAGEGLSQLGLRQAALGQTGQQLGQTEQGFLFDLGKQQQAQDQAVLEAQRQTELQQAYEPYQRVGFLSDIYKGAPTTQQTITAGTSPSVSPAQTILGLGIGGLSAAAGAKQAGLF